MARLSLPAIRCLALTALLFLASCAAAGEVAPEYADGLREDVAAPGQIVAGLTARGELRKYVSSLPVDQQKAATAQWLQDHPKEAAAIAVAARYGYVNNPDGSSHRVGNSQIVYDASQCIGAVVNGQCHGTIMPDGAHHPTCYGQMIGGSCTGPMF